MEKFNFEKHWDLFKREKKLVVNCPTEELANEFLKYCKKQGMGWSDNKDLELLNRWEKYNNQTCYENDKWGIVFCDINYFLEEEYQIVEFTGFIPDIEIIKETTKVSVPLKNGGYSMFKRTSDNKVVIPELYYDIEDIPLLIKGLEVFYDEFMDNKK